MHSNFKESSRIDSQFDFSIPGDKNTPPKQLSKRRYTSDISICIFVMAAIADCDHVVMVANSLSTLSNYVVPLKTRRAEGLKHVKCAVVHSHWRGAEVRRVEYQLQSRPRRLIAVQKHRFVADSTHGASKFDVPTLNKNIAFVEIKRQPIPKWIWRDYGNRGYLNPLGRNENCAYIKIINVILFTEANLKMTEERNEAI
ncbi:hypothetical protein TNCV_1304341 [Trichonephila clavipes]|nr:hypothetical protein TNCV_1304341 [Trichonephila clavipes]